MSGLLLTTGIYVRVRPVSAPSLLDRLSFTALSHKRPTFPDFGHHTMFLQCPPIFASQMLETNLPPPDLRSMDHFLAPSTPEALAHNHLTYVTHDMTLHLSLRFCLMAERTSSPGTQSIRPWTKLFSPGVPLIRPLTVISAAQISFCCPDPEVNSRAFCEFFWLDSGS